MSPKPRIIFMGTPDFSVPALERLARDDKFDVPLVVTQPDRPKGRGKKLAFSPVKEAAVKLDIDVFQPESLNNDEAFSKLSLIEPDFFVVAAFGQLLSRQILDIPKIYPINIHASLLPKYRGASPIQAAILNRDAETGVTTMVMADKMDTGDILLTKTTPVTPQDTAQALHDRLGQMGADLIVRTIHAVTDGQVTPVPQDETKATYVKLIKKKDGQIDWQKPAVDIIAHINGMTPWPSAFSKLNGQMLKIFKAHVADADTGAATSQPPGTVLAADDTGIHVATGQGTLVIDELMGASGKRLSAPDYLRGRKIEPLSVFDSK